MLLRCGMGIATVDERLQEAHGALVGQLDCVAAQMRNGDRDVRAGWAAFAAGLRDWLARERESLLPLIETRLRGYTDRGRLRIEQVQLERLLVRAGEQVERGAAEAFADTAHELLLLFWRHTLRERCRFAAPLDRMLTGAEREALLDRLRTPIFAAVH